jgi:dihydrodipicolinate synthase/N-acetylneuraminate lyase
MAQATTTTSSSRTPADVFARLRGPLVPILPAFDERENLDLDSVTRWVRHLIGQGISMFWTTHGTSHYMSMTDEEIVALNRAVASVAKGRALFIASTAYHWPTQRCIDFTRQAAECGVDAVKLQIDWRSFPPTDDQVVDRYRAIHEASPLPLFAYTWGTPGIREPLLRRILEMPKFIGLKNDTGDFYEQADYLRMIREAGAADRFTSMTGGTMGSFLYAYPYGARAFAVGTGIYAPDVAISFYDHVKGDHFIDAAEQVKRYERPITAFGAVGHHWACFHAALALQGHFASPTMRFPIKTLTKDQVEQVRKILESYGWLRRA